MHRRNLAVTRPASLPMEDAKQALRTELRKARADRSQRLREEAAKQIARHALPLLDGATTVACYVARPTEPPSSPIIDELHRRGVRLLLPALGPALNRNWAVYCGREDLAEVAPGRPPQPSGQTLPSSAVAEADVVIVPALSVDAEGNRLGQGGGWYDRVLTEVPPGVPIWAVLFDEEFAADRTLPNGPTDIPVHGVLRPSGPLYLREV